MLEARPLRAAVAALTFLLASAALTPTAAAQMPRRDVVDVPAIPVGLSVSNLFQSNMVLQRDKPIALWGRATAGAEVTLGFAGGRAAAMAGDDGRWRVELPALPASTEPRDLVVESAGERLTLENVLMGDVWVLGGQSNMEFELAKVENGALEIASANYDQLLRILTVPYGKDGRMRESFPPRVERLVQASLPQGRLGRLLARGREGALGDRLRLRPPAPHGHRRADRGDRRVARRDDGRVVDAARGPCAASRAARSTAKLADWDQQARRVGPRARPRERGSSATGSGWSASRRRGGRSATTSASRPRRPPRTDRRPEPSGQLLRRDDSAARAGSP